jgi:multiple sugar transport system substrate-binding protein
MLSPFRGRTQVSRSALLGLLLAAAPSLAAAQTNLVTPELIGRPDAPITLTISPRFAYSHQTNDPRRRAVLTDAFEAWVKRHPDVKIRVIVQQGDDAVIVAKRLQDVAGNRVQDAVMTEQVDYQPFFDSAQSFDPYLTKEEIKDFIPGVLKGMQHAKTAEVKYLQFTSYAIGLWYRRDLVEKPPASLEELKFTAAALKEKHGFRSGLFVLGGTRVTAHFLDQQVRSLGAKIVENDAVSTPIFGEGKNRETIIRVMKEWKDLVDSGLVPKNIVSFGATGDAVSRVAADEMPFMIGGSYLGGGIVGTGKSDKWAFAPMPQIGGAKPVPTQSGWSWAMFTRDKAKQALVTDLLMDVYVGRDGMARWGEAGGYTPTRTSVLNGYVAFAHDRLPHAYAELVAMSEPNPNGRNFAIVETALTNAFQQVVTGAQTPDAAVDAAWSSVKLEMQ